MDDRLQNAIDWCKENGLEFDAINENLKEIVELYGGDSRKIFAHEYIDDKANISFKVPFRKYRRKETQNNQIRRTDQ